ncbi:MAG: MFS transporter [Bacillota bacterium]
MADGSKTGFQSVLRHRDFRLIWAAQAGSYVGDRLEEVAFWLLAMRLANGSAVAVSLVLIASRVPRIIFGPLAGVMVDRWDKRKVMVSCDLIRAGIILTAPFIPRPELVYVLAFLMATVSTFFDPAIFSAVPETLSGKEEIVTANSLSYSTKFITDLAGYAAAAVVVGAIGLGPAFFIDSFSFVFSAALISRVLTRFAPAPAETAAAEASATAATTAARPTFLSQFLDGLRYHRANPTVLSLLVSTSMGLVAVGGINTLLVVAVPHLLGVPDHWLGYFVAVQAVGMTAVALALQPLTRIFNKARLVVLGFLTGGLAITTLAFTHDLATGFAIYFVMGLANTAFMAPTIAWAQEIVPFEYRGRVMALRLTVLNLIFAVSAPTFGFLADRLGIVPVLAAAGGVMVVAGVVSAFLPGFRALCFSPPPPDHRSLPHQL